MSNKNFLNGLFWSINRQAFADKRGVAPSVNYLSDAYLSDPKSGTSYNTTTQHQNAIKNFHDSKNEDYGYTYQQIADFFVMVCRVMHEHAPNVKMVLCAGLFDDATGKIEMEDIFLEAHKACDIWSGDNYLSLHWGWPNDIAKKPGTSFGNFDTEKTYQKFKKSVKRLREITGMNKPMVLSEMNADGDVNGPYDQARKLRDFMERLEADPDKWLDGFTLYQFRDDGRLGLEITDPNNNDVGIEQPILKSYRESLHKPFFSKKFETAGALQLPVKLRWSNSEDAEGIELDVTVEKDPHFAELYFKDDLIQANLMLEFDGWWFYKAPGVKCIDLMSYFFENKINEPCTMNLRIFAPPADGKNHQFGEGDEWMYNYYAELSSLPEIRLEYEPIVGADDEYFIE